MIGLMVLLALLCSGCVASNLAEVIDKLGDNPSTVCVTVTTVYGNGKALRTNLQVPGRVKCDMDGMAVELTAPK